jgi:hypothetical protein
MWGEDWGTMIWGSLVAVPTMGPFASTFLVGALAGAGVVLHRKPLSKAQASIAILALAIVPLVAAATTVPHTFQNGTVADADEINENFEAILGETARFHVTVAGGAPVAVPDPVMQELCADADGCEVVLVMNVGNIVRLLSSPTRISFNDFGGQTLWCIAGGTSCPADQDISIDEVARTPALGPQCALDDGDTDSSGDYDVGFTVRVLTSDSQDVCDLTIID